ncbi:hypothetical protein MAM1_0020c01777 [Mucor ambiguus]|uniref:PH domain-containing protein n=1 Tax=Mucor ambiguus TaxID=91626 RepID=A0A0C9M6G6_9FUNG|nr:hypothetical protein MAM1_0020c01777 [Mucor ambiguus]
MNPTIITFSVQDDSGLFLPQHNNDDKEDTGHKVSIEHEPPLIIKMLALLHNSDLFQKYPFSPNNQKSQNQSEPLLLSPQSILNKSGKISSSPNVLLLEATANGNEVRRPSLVKFSNNSTSNNTVFYDAVTEQQEKRKKSISATLASSSRRPSLISRISSAYTNKVADIPFHEIDPFDQHLLQQGIVLCANVLSAHQEIRKKALKWRKYRAVITQSGYLELYHLCVHQERNLLHSHAATATSCIHSYLPQYRKPRFIIDLHPSIDNLLFQKKHLFRNRRRLSASAKQQKALLDDTYFLSLMSPIDFSWSLISARQKFYFQTASISESQQWYQSLYACLPNKSKQPLPAIVDLKVPELSVCIRLPLSELIKLEEENIDLEKVRDSALVLLHRYGHRPPHWNRRTTGLNWRYKNYADWVVRPHSDKRDDENNAFLIESRLVEKTHELELRYYQEEEQSTAKPLEGYLNRIMKSGGSILYYAQSLGRCLFLFETEQEQQSSSSRQSCFRLLFSRKKNSTFPISNTSALKAVIDLSHIKQINYDEKAETLHLDGTNYCFQSVNQPIVNWSTRLAKEMRNTNTPGSSKIKMQDVLYVKYAASRYHTFEKKTCILTASGLFCILDKNSNIDFYSQLQQDEYYIYSGDTCCSYIQGLPMELPCRLFDAGLVVDQKDKPSQCCFVIHFSASKKEYTFLAKTQEQKEGWVSAIANM